MKIKKLVFLILLVLLIAGLYHLDSANIPKINWLSIKTAKAASTGDLIKTADISSVYYLGDDNKRYVFPLESIYFSWYKDFDSVITISSSELQSYPLGGNIAMRAGTKLVKITTDPAVYAVEPEGVLRKIKNEEQAKKLYGDNWAKRVQDIPDAFFTDYQIDNELADDELPDGSIINEIGTQNYYYKNSNSYQKIISAAAFNANRFYSEYIIKTDSQLNNDGELIIDSSQELLSLIQKRKQINTNNSNTNQNNNSGNISSGGSGSSGGSSGGGGGGSSSNCSGSDMQTCNIDNGQGAQNRTCSAGNWSTWGTCTVNSCNTGYQISGNSCVALTCEGSSTQSCSITNGQGSQNRTCNLGTWSNWSTCAVSSCDTGYQISGNSCVVSGGNLAISNTQKLIHAQDFAIASNANNGDVVGTINTFWRDWENKNLTYSIADGNTNFHIDNNGKITLVNNSALSGQSSIDLNIRAEDATKQEYALAIVTIRILSANDTYYIDPTVAISGNGSKDSPYKNWSDVTILSNHNYLQKRGTEATINSRINLNGTNNVTLGAYGNADARPKIIGWNLTGSSNGAIGIYGDNHSVRDLDIDARQSTSGIYIGASTNAVVDNCRIQNSEWALRTMVSGDGTKIINSEIAYTGDDGQYNQNHNNMEIAYNYFHHVNQKWNENSYWYAGKTEDESPGDSIQLNGTAFGFNIHHNILDRSDTGNKFCVLIGLIPSATNTNGLLENNHCHMGLGTQGFYVERGAVGIKIRYNTFSDGRGIFTHATDLLVAYNLFKNSRAYFGEPGASYQVYNNVFYDTAAGSYSVSMWRDNLDMRNNIFFFTNDTATGLQTSSQYTVITGNNLYSPNFRGAGASSTNIIADPLFIDPNSNDFRLQITSPAIGAGVNVGEDYDFYGNALNGNINIGLWQN